MSKWQKALAPLANDVETFFDRLKYSLEDRIGGFQPVRLVPLAAYTYPGGLYVKGRALHGRGPITSADNDSFWDDLVDLYRRMNSDEIPHARLRIYAGDQMREVQCDEEGFFELNLARPDGQLPLTRLELEWLPPSDSIETNSPDKNGSPVPVSLLPYAAPARFGVISDVDDTLLITHVQNLLGLARSLVSGRPEQRPRFPGAPALYRGLTRPGNPLFFVSSSPWNLHDLLDETFDYYDLPPRVTLLRDWGITDQEILPTENIDFKLGVLSQIIAGFPDLPFLLVGDSGQQDPEIYARFIRENPGRVGGVYIRDVSPDPRRDAAVQALQTCGVPLLLAPDSLSMARDAAARGWLDAAALAEVEEDQRRFASGG
ncbi:uncharacterized conserved protein [Longilinea arvoryzae]|uniref:Uncharacterized conserved protein n=1 Tax=Longilinea arvoryzae TaxID=360412 RepID=A0A0S7BII7_9CHLR|nr:phosphatase domain-containing protein [Longilinea arvoryzae]GAP13434.1 uncharacterized conserved protein [Longilinea arvoryzae]